MNKNKIILIVLGLFSANSISIGCVAQTSSLKSNKNWSINDLDVPPQADESGYEIIPFQLQNTIADTIEVYIERQVKLHWQNRKDTILWVTRPAFLNYSKGELASKLAFDTTKVKTGSGLVELPFLFNTERVSIRIPKSAKFFKGLDASGKLIFRSKPPNSGIDIVINFENYTIISEQFFEENRQYYILKFQIIGIEDDHHTRGQQNHVAGHVCDPTVKFC